MKKYSHMFKLVFLLTYTVLCTVRCFGATLPESQQEDTCTTAAKIKSTIKNFIENGDESIYNEEFITSFSSINEYHNACYFPGNNQEVKLYFFLGDSILVEKLKSDERAMKLLIDLYLVNKNNAELSEYYGSRIIPEAAIRNTKAFVMVLVGKTEREANKCIGKLKYIENADDIENIKKALDELKKPEYVAITNKIREKLQ